MKPGEEGLDLPEVTQLRRSGQDSAPGCLSPEPALLLSRARVTALRPGGPDPHLVAGPFSGCSELSVTEAAGLEAPPGCCPPCRSHLLALCLSLEGCPGPFKARLKCPIWCHPPGGRLCHRLYGGGERAPPRAHT